jgi:hypothetical protein
MRSSICWCGMSSQISRPWLGAVAVGAPAPQLKQRSAATLRFSCLTSVCNSAAYAALRVTQDNGAHIFFCGLKGMMPGIQEMLERVAKVRSCSAAVSQQYLPANMLRVCWRMLQGTHVVCTTARTSAGAHVHAVHSAGEEPGLGELLRAAEEERPVARGGLLGSSASVAAVTNPQQALLLRHIQLLGGLPHVCVQ